MNAELLALCLSVALNTACAAGLATWFHLKVKAASLTEKKGKNYFSLACLATGIFSGTAGLFTLMDLLNASAGHGEILIAGPAWNLLLTFVLMTVGRIPIGWEPIKW